MNPEYRFSKMTRYVERDERCLSLLEWRGRVLEQVLRLRGVWQVSEGRSGFKGEGTDLDMNPVRGACEYYVVLLSILTRCMVYECSSWNDTMAG